MPCSYHFVVTQQSLQSNLFFVSQKIRRGRPKVPIKKARSIFISTRLSSDESSDIEKGIRKSGIKKSDWIRKALLDAARPA
jgi:hypothetical protein